MTVSSTLMMCCKWEYILLSFTRWNYLFITCFQWQ